MEAPLAAELFERFIAPAVLGQKTHLLKPIGVRAAIAIEPGAIASDLLREVETVLLREARKYAPVDVVAPPTRDDWMLFAAWHDMLVAAHPDWNQPLRRYLAKRVLAHALATAQRVKLPQTVSEALTRHVWIAALKSIVRVDTRVSWWTGSALFRGTDPPGRLLALPDLRKVVVNRVPVESSSLSAGSALDEEMYQRVYALCLALSPLTDIASASRTAPPFAWTEASLALVATTTGRKLAVRAVRQWDDSQRAKAKALFEQTTMSLPEAATNALARFLTDLPA